MSIEPRTHEQRRRLAGWLGGLAFVAACRAPDSIDDAAAVSSGSTSSSSGGSTSSASTSTTTGLATSPPEGTTAATDDGIVFLLEPDGGSGFACSTLEQDCPRGEKCMPYSNDGGGSWTATRCVPIAEDPSGVGEPCTVVGRGLSGEDDCDGASMCWDLDPRTLAGTCVAFCIGPAEDPTCADPCATCPISASWTGPFCRRSCDPLLQTCPRGQGCYPVVDALKCLPDASPAGADVGSPCDRIYACPAGMACLAPDVVPGCPDGAAGCCTPFCPAGGVDPCEWVLPGTSCVSLFEVGAGPPAECYGALVGACMQGS